MSKLEEVIIFSQAVGGMGKTTLAHTFGNVLADESLFDKKVLMVDLTYCAGLTVVQYEGEEKPSYKGLKELVDHINNGTEKSERKAYLRHPSKKVGGLKEALEDGDASNYIQKVESQKNLYILPNNTNELKLSNFLVEKEVRGNANNVFETILAPAIEKLGIEVVIVDSPSIYSPCFKEMATANFGLDNKVVVPTMIDGRIESSLSMIAEKIIELNETFNTNILFEKIIFIKNGREDERDKQIFDNIKNTYTDKVSEKRFIFNADSYAVFEKGYCKMKPKNKLYYSELLSEFCSAKLPVE